MLTRSRLRTTITAMALAMLTLAAVTMIAPAPAGAVVQAQYYVDPVSGSDTNNGSVGAPFKTITRAQTAVRAINDNMTGDIVVHLRGGRYPITSTIQLTEQDNGTNGNRVIYAGYANEEAILDAGVRLTGWSDIGGGTWKTTNVPVDNFRQVYVNGVRADRARSGGLYTGSAWPNPLTSFTTDNWQLTTEYYPDGISVAGTVAAPTWANQSDMELVWVGKESSILWRSHRLPVDSIVAGSSGTSVIKMEQPYYGYAMTSASPDQRPRADRPFYLENAYELLDQPGEWYLNRTTNELFYKPRPGENMATAEVYVPGAAATILSVRGASQSTKATAISVQNITFRHTTWLRPSTQGAAAIQASKYISGHGQIGRAHKAINRDATTFDPAYDYVIDANGEAEGFKADAAIELDWADGVDITRNRFEHLGGAGVDFTQGVTNTSVVGNAFVDISEAAVVLGRWDHDHTGSGEEQPKNDVVSNNWIHQAGAEYYNSVPITAFYTDSVVISHNEIDDAPYSGITSGWGWAKTRWGANNRRNVIENNKITNIAHRASDGGAIYTLGNGKAPTDADTSANRSKIRNNYASGIAITLGGGLYPDEGSSYYEITNNVHEDNTVRWLYIHAPSIHDLLIDGNFSNTSSVLNNGTNTAVTNHTTYSGTSRPAGAASVIASAGLEPAYADIRTPSTGDILIDNGDAGYVESGTWNTSGIGGYDGESRFTNGASTNTAAWRPMIANAGSYGVFVSYPAHSTNIAGVDYTVTHGGGTANVVVDQSTGGGTWVSLGTYTFAAGLGGNVSVRGETAGQAVRADAVKFVPNPAEIVIDDGDPGYAEIGTWHQSGLGGYDGDSRYTVGTSTNTATWRPTITTAGSYEVFARYPADATNATGITYRVTHASGTTNVVRDQTTGGGTWVSLGTYSFAAGTAGSVAVLGKGASQPVRADAIRFVLQ